MSKQFSGARLREKRELKGRRDKTDYSQAKLAYDLSMILCRAVSSYRVGIWERGQHSPNCESLGALSKVFGCKIDDFFCE